MPRKGKRITFERGIYRDGPDGPYEVRIVVGRQPYSERMPADSTLEELRGKRGELENVGNTTTPRAERGTVRAGVPSYLRAKAHLASVGDLEDDLEAWCVRIGDRQRHRLTERDILEARGVWIAAGLSPKTVNDRVGTLRNFLRVLDGKKALGIFDDIDPLPIAKTPIQRVSDALIRAVDLKLQEHELDGKHGVLKDGKTRARFRVFVSTGKRPCEIMRAQPGDVNLDARVWVPRDAKGGFCPGVYLNDDMLAAWTLFIEKQAWGPYNHGNFGRVIRSAGWPKDVKPYQARHTHWIMASELGIDLADIATGAGHTDVRTTRRSYVPVLNSRLQAMSERMDGRFGGWRVVPASAPVRKRGPRKKIAQAG